MKSTGLSTRECGIWVVRQEAESLAEELANLLDASLYKPWLTEYQSQIDLFRSVFGFHRKWILIMTTGIAVRFLDGIIVSKYEDPGVVVLDESANFAVSLLGGHEGGANKLASRVAELVGAIPVLTTASESSKPLSIGVGARKGISVGAVERAVELALSGRPVTDIREVATIEFKRDEAGIREFAERLNVPLRVFAKEAVASRLWNTGPSDWVMKNIGVFGVCEPCALMANPRGILRVPKTTLDGVAVAVVEDSRCWV